MTDSTLERKSIDTEAGELVYFCRNLSIDRPTVVLLHGLSANHTTWRRIMEDLAARGFATIAPDLRGHGYSAKPKKRRLYRLSRMKEDIRQIMEKEGVDCAHFVGYSWGGYITLDFASTYPEKSKSLVLISTNFMNHFFYSPIFFLARTVRTLVNLAGWLMLWQKRATYYYFNQDEDLGYWKSTYTGLSTMPISINFWMLSEAMSIDFKNALPKIEAPTLILYGAHDRYITEREMRDMSRLMQNARAEHLPDGNHFLATQSQDDVARHIIRFLETQI